MLVHPQARFIQRVCALLPLRAAHGAFEDCQAVACIDHQYELSVMTVLASRDVACCGSIYSEELGVQWNGTGTPTTRWHSVELFGRFSTLLSWLLQFPPRPPLRFLSG